MKTEFAWGADRKVMINLNSVRNISISNNGYDHSVTAWWNDKESLEIGRFSDINKAQSFIEKLTGGGGR